MKSPQKNCIESDRATNGFCEPQAVKSTANMLAIHSPYRCMGKGHGRSIELNMDYGGIMSVENVLRRSNVVLIESQGICYTIAIVL